MIPVSRPQLGEREQALVLEAVRAGEISGSSGRFIKEFEDAFAKFCGTRYAISCSSGSTALHLACAAIGLDTEDEILVSAATNIASANAAVMCGATIVPVDCEPDTWQMNTNLLRDLVSPLTKAIMPVHLFGHPVDMTEVMEFAREYGLKVIEDCAEAHGAECNGQRVGSFGDIGCFSFYANKLITTGEGGMCVTNDAKLAEQLRLLRNLAFTTPRFKHDYIGFNYRLTNVQAAIGVAQMERLQGNIAGKRALAREYTNVLQHVPGLRLPVEKDWAHNVYWMYGVVVEPQYPLSRDQLMKHLEDRGIETRTMFCPMQLQPALDAYLRFVSCPEAEDLWRHGFYLPSSVDLTDAEIQVICEAMVAPTLAGSHRES